MKTQEKSPYPCDGDPSWKETCKPLLVFLEEPRSYTELREWIRMNKISHTLLIQMIAWCENRKLIDYFENKWYKKVYAKPVLL